MKILYYIPHVETLGAEHWIYLGWKHAFEDRGHSFLELTAWDNWSAATDRYKPDILLVANAVDLWRRKDDLLRSRQKGVFVFLIVGEVMRWGEAELLREFDLADIYYWDREPEFMRAFEIATGRKYHRILSAADSRLNYPSPPVKEYSFDIVYLGANLPKKRKMFREVLVPLARKYKVGIFGSQWTLSDNLLRIGERICRDLRLVRLASRINAWRIDVLPEEENVLYSSAAVCLNFHEREKDGSLSHGPNQRTFKIPACGGFQICDELPTLRDFFAEDEVVMARDPADWFEQVDYWLSHPEERRAVQDKGIARALRDHVYLNRVQQVEDLYGRKTRGCAESAGDIRPT